MKKIIIKMLRPIIARFPKLAITYLFLRDSSSLEDTPKKTPLGFKFIGNQSMQNGKFEPDESSIVTQLLPKVDMVINVGANIGYYCCLALSHKKHVVAFEPINLNVRYLLKNIKENGWGAQIEIFPIALSDKIDVMKMYGGGTGASLLKGWANIPDFYSSLVPCSTLNNVLGTKFQGKKILMIVDIEGAEKMMLEGASIFMEMKPKPIWLIEISIFEHQPKGVDINPNLFSTFQMFWAQGYESWTADKKCKEVKAEEIMKIIQDKQDTLLTHNFIFIEKSRRNELNFLFK
jgi:FkbM family methyltransferase